MARATTLSAIPDLRRLYASAAFHRGTDRDSVPDERFTLAGLNVDLDDLADYSHLCGFSLTGILPLTYPHLLAFPLQMVAMAGDGFPLPLLGAVHVENVVTVHRPLYADDLLDLVVHAQNLRPHRRGRQVDLVTEVSVAGELAWHGVSTYLARGAEHPKASTTPPPSLDGAAAPTEAASYPVWHLGENTGRSYAAVSGDWNPIHVHALTARPLGFPSAIAHGMFTYARAVAALAPRLPDAGVTSRVWFRKPVRLPSTVRLRSVVTPGRTLSRLESAHAAVEHAVIEQVW
ncbi:MAG: MaoC/PaaZ C-terminal domain-containing protein [Terracoccus sp.]